MELIMDENIPILFDDICRFAKSHDILNIIYLKCLQQQMSWAAEVEDCKEKTDFFSRIQEIIQENLINRLSDLIKEADIFIFSLDEEDEKELVTLIDSAEFYLDSLRCNNHKLPSFETFEPLKSYCFDLIEFMGGRRLPIDEEEEKLEV
jgi:hypothetical protein